MAGQNSLPFIKDYTRRPHLYVLYTASGQEQELIQLLYKTIVEAPDETKISGELPFYEEFLFSPVAMFSRKMQGQFTEVPRRLYPGYIFLSTNVPENFYCRLIGTSFSSCYGKYLRMLKSSDMNNKAQGISSDVEMQPYMARLSDGEEKGLLGLMGLKRDQNGNIVHSEEPVLSENERKRLENAGVHFKTVENKQKGETNDFIVSPSKGVKIGMGPGSKIVVFDGPLMGREGLITKVNRHKRVAWIKVPFMGEERQMQVPLSVVKVIRE